MKLTKQRIKEIIKEELDSMNEEPEQINEAEAGLTMENLMLILEAIKKMAPMIMAMGVPVFIGLMYESVRESMSSDDRQGEIPRGDM